MKRSKTSYMGKSKELFMKLNYPQGDWDIEREWMIDNSLKQEQEYLEYEALKKDPEACIDYTKIEVEDGSETRIEVHQEEQESNTTAKVTGNGL